MSLQQELDERVATGAVKRTRNAALGLTIYTYSQACVYDRLWDDVTMQARGLIFDDNGKLVARPFPKFFNYGEMSINIPHEPFQVFEKLDGSLGIVFYHDGRWRCATKGSLDSEQSRWAEGWLSQRDLSCLNPVITYLFEIIYPENRIVVRYNDSGLRGLAAYYTESGVETSYAFVEETCKYLNTSVARMSQYDSVDQVIWHAATLDSQSEGFVVRFKSGYRVKIKGAEYTRIHRIIANITPIGIWELMYRGTDLDSSRRNIPEEYWGDFDQIVQLLSASVAAILKRVADCVADCAQFTDKEVGWSVHTLDSVCRAFIFAARKKPDSWHKEGKTRETLMRMVRPTGNRLDGYSASSKINAVLADE
jgi:RNA ligase